MKLRTFQYYVADCAQILCNNVANGLGGQIVETRLADLFNYNEKPTESAEEIIDRITSGLNGLGELNERI